MYGHYTTPGGGKSRVLRKMFRRPGGKIRHDDENPCNLSKRLDFLLFSVKIKTGSFLFLGEEFSHA